MAEHLPFYRADLATVHDRGFPFHADACAPGILAMLEPLLHRGGLVHEFGCGSGHLTRHLVAAGHRVVATDASPMMLELARANVPDVNELRLVALPQDHLPTADAVVSVGHALSYLPSERDILAAVEALAQSLTPGGVIAFDLCDVRYGQERRDTPNYGRAGEDWAIVTEFSVPTPDRFVRQIAVFLRNPDGTWRRDDERHDNILIDTSRVPDLLARYGVQATVSTSFGDHELPGGLVAITGTKQRQT